VPGYNGGGSVKTILVVDDEPTLAATVRYNLEQGGYQVITAADGESGLSHPPGSTRLCPRLTFGALQVLQGIAADFTVR
jgi:CheY-like chemotaxis protein